MGGFCGEQATKHSCHNGKSGRQVHLVHTLNYTRHDPTVLENKASAPHLNGLLGDAGGFTAVSRFKRVSPIICFVVAILPEK